MIFYWEPDGSLRLKSTDDYELAYLKHLIDYNGKDFTLIANGDPFIYGIRLKPIDDGNERKS